MSYPYSLSNNPGWVSEEPQGYKRKDFIPDNSFLRIIHKEAKPMRTEAHTTKEGTEIPVIQWTRHDFNETINGMREYNASGKSDDGREWIGSWMEMSGECVDVDYIQEA